MYSIPLYRNVSLNSLKHTLIGLKYSSQPSHLQSNDTSYKSASTSEEISNTSSKNRNKSRLLPQHRNLLHETVPYSEPSSWIHLTEKYQRKLYGQFGDESRVNPRICFKIKEDFDEYEKSNRHVEIHTLFEMMDIVKKETEEKKRKVKKREDDIAANLLKLDQWKSDLNAKIAKKEAEALKAKERKERLIEEVRRHFGFKVDPREERFKEMLEQKEREDKKKQKEERRKAKEEKAMAKIMKKSSNLEQ